VALPDGPRSGGGTWAARSVISLEALSKRYGPAVAVDDESFEVASLPPGEAPRHCPKNPRAGGPSALSSGGRSRDDPSES
jgi:hypothetical protein